MLLLVLNCLKIWEWYFIFSLQWDLHSEWAHFMEDAILCSHDFYSSSKQKKHSPFPLSLHLNTKDSLLWTPYPSSAKRCILYSFTLCSFKLLNLRVNEKPGLLCRRLQKPRFLMEDAHVSVSLVFNSQFMLNTCLSKTEVTNFISLSLICTTLWARKIVWIKDTSGVWN